MKRTLQHPLFHLTLGILSFLLLFFNVSFLETNSWNTKTFNRKLHQKEKIAEETLNILMNKEETLDFSLTKQYQKLNTKDGISFFILKNGKINFWTNRSIDFSTDLTAFKDKKGLVQLKNGWYQYLLKKSHEKSYLALILIKNNYSIRNKFLNNNFHESFGIPNHLEIVLEKTNQNIVDLNGAFLFSLKPTSNKSSSKDTNWMLLLYFLSGYCFLISFLSKQTKKIATIRKYSPILVILFIVLSRVYFIYFHPFTTFFNQELFSPIIFAQSNFLPSLGDLIISAFLLAIVIYYLAKAIKKVNAKNKIILFLCIFISAISPLILAQLLAGLITNSKINFDINYLLDLNAYSFAGIGSITLLFVALILFIKLIINHFRGHAFNNSQLHSLLHLAHLLAIIIGHFFLEINALLTIWVLLVVLAFSFKINSKTSFYRSVFLILIVASTTSYGFIDLGKLKEEVNKTFIAKKLAKERDPVSEYLYDDLQEKIINDSLVKNSIPIYLEQKERIDNYISNHFFSGYFSKYEPRIIGYFNNTDSIYVEAQQKMVHCFSFFENKIEKEAEDPFRTNKSLHFLYSEEGVSSYFTKIELNAEEDSLQLKGYSLFIELFPKQFSKTEGYPELLLNQKEITDPINTNTYSFAKYKKGKLVDNFGKYNYSIELSNKYHFNEDGFVKATFGAAYHVIYQSDKNTVIILSSPQKTAFNYITTFSYFFIITSILVLILGLFFRIAPFNWQIALNDFSTKIQLFIIASIFLAFLLFSWGTSYYIKKQYLEKNKTHLAEKVQSVLIELEHKLGYQDQLTSNLADEMAYYLVKFSNVFYTDINLYNKEGVLLATSRPEIFDRGLVSQQMNPEAYHQIHWKKKSNYTHSENIGDLNYISTYVPFRNEKQEILAYMNLPYFAKQNELENELSSFYTALINIYGLLFLISTIIAVFFANYISAPVRMIKNKISALQLGQSYDLLEWDSNDEIGALVFEYNKKVIELEQNAALLVKSERESAWREMAKQVAHEIKNPLTPMKLGIQQLERVAKDKPADLDERIARTAKTLVEQIDTLTKIADEFSNFAKMPKADEQEINLVPIVETIIDLYKDEEVEISLSQKQKGNATILADKDQISRVFSNLIKNAIQAIPSTVDGKIAVLIHHEEGHYIIEIKDNGSGISEDKKNKIFVPNFTTKSTGMGLGLAMVKNSVENAHGSIWFETKVQVGTSFFVKLPKA
jgi:signal transduction histidine kinase